jgi:SulP family sulfate permease
VGAALRETLREGYTRRDFAADAMAGVVVGIVALPLAMALAIASGVPPQHGLYTSIVAGAVIATIGGSRYQISGPTAAFVAILAPIAVKFGLGGLLVATAMAGILLLVLGFAKLGKIIEYIPHPVLTGFTAGIGVTIAAGQVRHLLGLHPESDPSHFLEKAAAYAKALPTFGWGDCVVGFVTLTLLLVIPRITRRIPAPLLALSAAAILAEILRRTSPGFYAATIGNSFSYVAGGETHPGIPQLPPLPAWPWEFGGAGGAPMELSIATIRDLLPSAFAIAVLGAIESLLSAAVADGMSGRKHDSNAELIAQGAGNLVAPFFGGIAATGAIARTATGIRAGARSPIAAIVHSGVVLLSILVLAPWLGYLPMSALAALLVLVAWNMSEAKHFVRILRVAPRADVVVLLTCFSLTVVFDMVISVTFGVLLAALLFMKRMADVTNVNLLDESHHEHKAALPKATLVYEIAGPLFFGAAQKAMGALSSASAKDKTVILDIESVPTIDLTGLVALESALDRLWKSGAFVVISGVGEQPASVLEKAGFAGQGGKLAICKDYADAVDIAWTREAQLTVRGAARAAT